MLAASVPISYNLPCSFLMKIVFFLPPQLHNKSFSLVVVKKSSPYLKRPIMSRSGWLIGVSAETRKDWRFHLVSLKKNNCALPFLIVLNAMKRLIVSRGGLLARPWKTEDSICWVKNNYACFLSSIKLLMPFHDRHKAGMFIGQRFVSYGV